MPRAAAFSSVVLEELLRQLEYAPRETHLRQMDAAESLLEDLHADQLYPEDFITYRITGYRSDLPGPRTSVVGDALQRDLVTFIQSLSWDLDLNSERSGGGAIEMDELARRLGVSRRTLQRYRSEGLVMHYVRQEDGQRRLACFPDALERFLASSAERVSMASTFSRIPALQRVEIINQARAIAGAEGTSLNETARRISVSLDRSHEAIRSILLAHDRSVSEPIFREHGILTRKDARFIQRARTRGVPMADIASHFGKSVSALHRSVLRDRRRRLGGLPLVWRTQRFDHSPLGATGILHDLPHHALLSEREILEGAVVSKANPVRLKEDRAAHAMLISESAKDIALIPRIPTVEQLDGVETRLRHAAMLQLRMMLACLPNALSFIEDHLGQSMMGLPSRERESVLQLVVDVLNRVIEDSEVDAGDAIPGISIERLQDELDRGKVVAKPGRATIQYQPTSRGLEIMLRQSLPWEWLIPSTLLVRHLQELDQSDADLVVRRYGFGGDAPRTLSKLAEDTGMTAAVIERRIGRYG